MTATSNEQLLRDVREFVVDELTSFLDCACSQFDSQGHPLKESADPDDREHIARLEALLNRLNIALGDVASGGRRDEGVSPEAKQR